MNENSENLQSNMSSNTTTGEGKNSAAVEDVASSSITSLSQQSSDSSSQATSSQGKILHYLLELVHRDFKIQFAIVDFLFGTFLHLDAYRFCYCIITVTQSLYKRFCL